MNIHSSATPAPGATVQEKGTILIASTPRQSVIPVVALDMAQWNGYHRAHNWDDATEQLMQQGFPLSGSLSRSLAGGDDSDGQNSVNFVASLADGAHARREFTGFHGVIQRRFRSLYSHYKFKLPSAYGAITGRRWRVGIYAAGANLANQDPGGACIEFVADASRDSAWQFGTHDGTTYSIVSTGASFAADDALHFLEFGLLPNGNAWYRADAGATVEKSTNLPPNTTVLDRWFTLSAQNIAPGTGGIGPAMTIYRQIICW
jgi:hypothetical protein